MKTLAVVCIATLTGLACWGPTLAAQTDGAQREADRVKKVIFREVPGPSRADHHGGEPLIWNGQVAAPGQFPYYVAVYMDMSYFCGGSLIHPKWVLTAAHCVEGISIWTMFMGITSLVLPKENGRQVHISRGGLLHEDWDSNRIINDIGLIQLLNDVDVTSSSRIGVVKLTPPNLSYIGQTPTVAGFGYNEDSFKIVSDTLKFTKLPIVSNDLCYSIYGDMDESWICLQTDEVRTSSCSGDSGGPLVVYDANNVPTQIGATSFGASGGCSLGYPVGFTNLALFIDWIAEHTGIPSSKFVASPSEP